MWFRGFRWEYGRLAFAGDWLWAKTADPALRFAAGGDDLTFFQRTRAAVQLTVLAAVLLLPLSVLSHSRAHVLTASGLLFDIAGVMRLFLLERITHEISTFKPNEQRKLSISGDARTYNARGCQCAGRK
jgi:hypothetical protein